MDSITLIRIQVWRAVFPLRFAFSHNLATRNRVETLIIQIHTSKGSHGYGQALPRAYLTGETTGSVLKDIASVWWPKLSGMTFPSSAGLDGAFEQFRSLLAEADALRCTASFGAVEMASLDGLARAMDLPLRLAGGSGSGKVPLVGVISAGSPKWGARLTRLLRFLGYRHYKVKVGTDALADHGLLSSVRQAAGPDAWLAVDANQAWEWDEAVVRLRELKEYGVHLVEEPLRRETAEVADYLELAAKTGVQLMADESVCTVSDARKLLRQGGPSWWNLRLAKNGGLSGFSVLSDMARDNGIHIYGGILVGETSALAAAGRAAWQAGGVRCGEYGFPRIFLRGDPFRGGPGGWNGWSEDMPAGITGLGVTLNESFTRKMEPIWVAES